jgi:5-(carboxyamino)imidazole ribonucleotide synthase
LLVNEIAPRPHNSGHFSMDGASISQFEQLVRAITGLKLGSPQFYFEGFMQNLIGDEINKIDEYYNVNNARIYLYGKGDAKDGRKMGHINFLTNKI